MSYQISVLHPCPHGYKDDGKNYIAEDIKRNHGWKEGLSEEERDSIIYDSCELVLGPCE